jgi:hypothetical protein
MKACDAKGLMPAGDGLFCAADFAGACERLGFPAKTIRIAIPAALVTPSSAPTCIVYGVLYAKIKG